MKTKKTVFAYDAIGQLVAEYSTQLSQTPNTSYMTADHLNSPRIQTSATGQVISRHDYQPFGEEIQRANYGADEIRKKFTGYERDTETNLDYAQARYYSQNLGRFISTDPILISHKRAIDPQRINLYIYSRNNPLKYIDIDGEDIEEPTGLNAEDQQAYEKWRDEYLSTEEGRKNWDKYKNDKNFLLKIVVADRGSDTKNKSAQVKDFSFDANGNFTGATMLLGKNLGKNLPSDSNSYPISTNLNTTDSAEIGAVKIAHEFGHLNDFLSKGKDFYAEQQILSQIQSRHEELTEQRTSPTERGKDPLLNQLNQKFKSQFGISVEQNSVNRDKRAERNAIPTIRQIVGQKNLKGERQLLKEKL